MQYMRSGKGTRRKMITRFPPQKGRLVRSSRISKREKPKECMKWIVEGTEKGEGRSRISYRHEEREGANRGVKRPRADFGFFFTLVDFMILILWILF